MSGADSLNTVRGKIHAVCSHIQISCSLVKVFRFNGAIQEERQPKVVCEGVTFVQEHCCIAFTHVRRMGFNHAKLCTASMEGSDNEVREILTTVCDRINVLSLSEVIPLAPYCTHDFFDLARF